MSHRLILRAAIGLTLLLVVASLAFSLATSRHELRLASASATGSAAPAVYDEKVAAASFENRCAQCHAMEDFEDWLAANAGPEQSARLLDFLKEHQKSPDSETGAIARFVVESSALKP